MAEAIGVASGIVGIFGFGLQLATTLQTYVEAVLEAPERLRDIAFEVSSTASALKQLQDIIDDDNKDDGEPDSTDDILKRPKVFKDDGRKEIETLAGQCGKVYVVIVGLVSKAGPSDSKGKMKTDTVDAQVLMTFSISRSMIWPWVEPRIKRCQEQLRWLKMSLLFNLQLATLARFQIATPMRAPGSYEEERELKALAEELRARRVTFAKDLASKRKGKGRTSTWNEAEANSVNREGSKLKTVHRRSEKDASPNRVEHLNPRNERGSGIKEPVLTFQGEPKPQQDSASNHKVGSDGTIFRSKYNEPSPADLQHVSSAHGSKNHDRDEKKEEPVDGSSINSSLKRKQLIHIPNFRSGLPAQPPPSPRSANWVSTDFGWHPHVGNRRSSPYPRDPYSRVDTPPGPAFQSFLGHPLPPPPPGPGQQRPRPFPNCSDPSPVPPVPRPPPPFRPGPPPPPPGFRPPPPPPPGVQGQSGIPGRPPFNSIRLSIIEPPKEMDEDACREKLSTYKAFTLRRLAPSDPKKESPSWAKIEICEESLDQEVLAKEIKKLSKSRRSVLDKRVALSSLQNRQVTRVLDDMATKETDGNFQWTLVQLGRKKILSIVGFRKTSTITVYVKRAPIKDLNAIGLYQAIERIKQQRREQMNRPPPRPDPPGERVGGPEIIHLGRMNEKIGGGKGGKGGPEIIHLGRMNEKIGGDKGGKGGKLSRPQMRYHHRSSVSSGYSSDEESESEYHSSSGTDIIDGNAKPERVERVDVRERRKSRFPSRRERRSLDDEEPQRVERVIVEERRGMRRERERSGGSDKLVVIEEHSPPRRSKIKRERRDGERIGSGHRFVDPMAYAGAVDGRRKSSRRERDDDESSDEEQKRLEKESDESVDREGSENYTGSAGSDRDIKSAATSDAELEDLDEELGIEFDFTGEEENANVSISALLGKLTNATNTVGGVESNLGG